MSTPPPEACLACASEGLGPPVALRERIVGLDMAFCYQACLQCGTLQRCDAPRDLAQYYDGAYYSFDATRQQRAGLAGRMLRRARARHALGLGSVVGRVVAARAGVPCVVAWMAEAGATFDDPILDVGCGAGDFVHALRNHGFRGAMGIDPHLDADRVLNNGALLRKATLEEVSGPFAVVLMSHSLEHMNDPAAALLHARAVLAAEGCLVLRVPLADSRAYEEYGPDWVQLDPPRHAFVPTSRGVVALADRCGYAIQASRRDSTGFQFWGSELTRRGVPIQNAGDAPEALFEPRQLAEWNREAEGLNREGLGDQGLFLLRKQEP